ncbi:MAG TPA: hypothetical protein VIK61_19615, partial [Acidimicrobiia bacterium]
RLDAGCASARRGPTLSRPGLARGRSLPSAATVTLDLPEDEGQEREGSERDHKRPKHGRHVVADLRG